MINSRKVFEGRSESWQKVYTVNFANVILGSFAHKENGSWFNGDK